MTGRAWGIRVWSAALLGLALSAGPARAEPEPEKPLPLISNVFMDTDLRQALQDVAAQAKVNIMPGPGVNGYITAELDAVTVDKALEILLAGTGYEVLRRPDYYLIYSPEPSSPVFREICQTRLMRLDHVAAAAAVKMLGKPFQDYVQVDAKTNCVLITAHEKVMGRIVEALTKIDAPRRHVLLDCRVVVLEHSRLLNLGLDWDFPRVQVGGFSTSDYHGAGVGLPGAQDWPWAVQIGYSPSKQFTDSLILTLELLQQNEEATIMATPQVMAQDGRSAEINVSREEYFKVITGGIYEQARLEKIATGTVLTMLPRITGTNEITLEMSAEVSDVVARGEDNLPVVTRRQTKSTVRVEDGGTMAVAGLMDARTRQIDRQVPGVWLLPLVGRLFESQKDDSQTRQISIFVTARIVPDGIPPPPPVRKTIPLVNEALFRFELAEALVRLREEEVPGQ